MNITPTVVTVDVSFQKQHKSVFDILYYALYDKHRPITYNELVLLCLEHNLNVDTVITIFNLRLKDPNK